MPAQKDPQRKIQIKQIWKHATNTWAIELKETGEAIGAMGYGPSCECDLPAHEGEPLIGYWVAKPYWNQGICTEALQLTDAASKEMIWRDGDTEYYPSGVTDPNYCVLKFTATDGRFYSDFYPRSFVIE